MKLKKIKMLQSVLLMFCLTAFSSCSKDNEQETVDPPSSDNVLTAKNAASYMVDPNATKETIALFYNLKKLAATKTALGQHDAFNSFYQDLGPESDIKKNTGNDPAILGSDFIFIANKNNNGAADNWYYQQEQKVISDVKSAYAKGIINTFSWHLQEPIKEEVFYTADMTPEQKNNALKSILPGGAYHEWYKKKLDKAASIFLSLKGSNGELIPIIFRPFHEFDGGWFWWGANYCTPEEYKTIYKFTVEYLRDTKGVHNLLYAFSPDASYQTVDNYLSRYPGDKYVDVLGMDNYADFNNKGQSGSDNANLKLKMISDLAQTKVKIAALTETGYRVTAATAPISNWFSTYLYNALTKNEIQISYAMFWNNDLNGYFVPNATVSNASDFKTFASKPKAALLNSLPKMYVMP